MRPFLAALLVAAGCASAPPPQPPPPPAPPGAPEVRAVRVREPVIVDGVDNDAAWKEAPESEIPLDGERLGSCGVRAAVCEGTIYFAVCWKDSTETRERPGAAHTGPWWNNRDAGIGDLVALTFPIGGAFFDQPDPQAPCAMDHWEWDARAGDRRGRAIDAVLSNPTEGFEGRDWFPYRHFPALKMHMDDGASMSSGSIADVPARGQWRDGEWTVEFARALETGHDDDRSFSGLAEIPFRITVRDLDAQLKDESDRRGRSPVLRLLLPPPEDPRRGPLPEPLGPPGTAR